MEKKSDASQDEAFFAGDIIINTEGAKIAASQHGHVFLGTQELHSYTFLEVIIISKTNIKSKRWAILTLSKTNDSLTLASDT